MPRPLLEDVHSAEHVVRLLQGSKKIIVITGAGVSVSCGIPDFRSKESGLYNTLDCSSFGIPSAELLFDLEFFQIDPAPFYQFAPALLPKNEMRPSPCHRFVALLESKKKLLRNYSQNVDGLERKTGMKNVLECHGTMSFFHCTGPKCKKKKPLEEMEEYLQRGEVPYCESCSNVMKPGVTFFGEKIPKAFDQCLVKDVPKADLVIVIGTSLKVGGSVYELIRQIPTHVPQILINKEPVCLPKAISDGFDVTLLGNCDDVVSYLSEQLQWTIPPFVSPNATASSSVSSSGAANELLSASSSVSSSGAANELLSEKEEDRETVGVKRDRDPEERRCESQTKKKAKKGLLSSAVQQWQCSSSSERLYSITPVSISES